MESIEEFIKFENEIMEKFLQGQDGALSVLRAQYLSVKEKSREFTGVGFFTRFSVSDDTPKLEHPKTFQLDDVIGEINGVQNGVGFVLYIKEGAIRMLEGYTYGDEKWPDVLTDYQISYLSGEARDIYKIRAMMEPSGMTKGRSC